MTERSISTAKTPRPRPLSPHLGIYKAQISSVLSITHRATGIALGAGSVLFVIWLWTAAYSRSCFEWVNDALATPFGLILLVLWTLALFYHLSNGIRHLVWDAGKGFSIPAMTASGWAVIISTFVLTAALWWMALSM